jgi:broad specificity phosphatase PhoE
MVVFIRHVHADGGENDRERQLSEQGKAQVQARKEKLNGPGLFDLVIISPADRCRQTAAILAKGTGAKMVELGTLYPDPATPDGAVIDKVYQKLGPQPIAAYLETEAEEALHRYGVVNKANILQLAMENDARKILVVGHAALSQMIGLMLGRSTALHNTMINEAEGFQVNLTTHEIDLLQ